MMDDKMTAKQYLSQAYRLNQRIDGKLQQLAQLKDMAVHVTTTLNDMKVQSSPNLQKMESTILKIVQQEQELNDEIDRLVELKDEIRHVVDAVESQEQKFLLEERYLCFRSWEQIAAEMGYGIDNVFKLHRKALSAVVIPK